MIVLTATPKASSRTKNRMREHGHEFELIRVANASCMHGRQSALVVAPDGWKGWLPLDELQENVANTSNTFNKQAEEE